MTNRFSRRFPTSQEVLAIHVAKVTSTQPQNFASHSTPITGLSRWTLSVSS